MFLKTNEEIRLFKKAVSFSNNTPYFVYDLQKIKIQIKKINNAFKSYKNFELLYAVKANNNSEVIRTISRLGVGFHVSSLKEIMLVRKFSKNISFTGPIIVPSVLKLAENNNLKITANSISDLRRLSHLQDVGIRINPGIGYSPFSDVASGNSESQFGASIEEFNQLSDRERKFISRLHMHTSSDSFKIDPFINAFKKLLSIAANNPRISTIDIGGGMGILNGKEMDISKLASGIIAKAKEFNRKHDRNLKIEMEPGSYIVRQAGIYVCKIHSVRKRNNGFWFYSDGSVHHLRGLILGRSFFGLKRGRQIRGKIFGATCQTGDILIGDTKMLTLRENDLIAIANAGAYCSVQANNFNMIGLPKEFCI